MTTEVEIANLALNRVGASEISSLDDPVDEARVCKRELAQAISFLLRDTNWNFATKWVTLPPSADGYNFPDFDYTFLLPADYVKVQAVRYPDQRDYQGNLARIKRWNISGRYLGVSYESPVLEYTFDAPVGVWEGMAVEALINRLAYFIATPLSRSQETKAEMQVAMVNSYRLAIAEQGKEGIHDRTTTDNRLRAARGRGRTW